MSKLALRTGDDFPEAAKKHLDDAILLLNEGRGDNAAYLAGYVVECTLKTLILLEQGHAWGHDLDQLSQKAQELAALPGARTARYASTETPGHSIYHYGAGGWKETLRYLATGSILLSRAADWVVEAERVYLNVIGNLWLDGELS
ncbi:MAG: HEPN domain-containing protein [Thermoanaerobaculia bacterium]|nr:HEPN domain-containing protein [Thermoanaerobaculia bacterium]